LPLRVSKRRYFRIADNPIGIAICGAPVWVGPLDAE
jgi:hypothetical protein